MCFFPSRFTGGVLKLDIRLQWKRFGVLSVMCLLQCWLIALLTVPLHFQRAGMCSVDFGSEVPEEQGRPIYYHQE